MKALARIFFIATCSISVVLLAWKQPPVNNRSKISFPYQQAGLTERQAAAHLLSRFTFGAKPGDVEAVVNQGLDKWFLQQLDGKLPDDSVQQVLQQYDALQLSNAEVVKYYPRPVQVRQMAIKEGYLKDSSVDVTDKKVYREQLAGYMQQKGLKPLKELYRQFINQKIIRATASNNQLTEVLTDFWFNHFNVSITKTQCAQFIPVYERDVIRPNVTGKFENLVLSTAQSPAMLLYLDNFSSAGTNSQLPNMRGNKKYSGLNENYAREVMELHTMGVDGGYTQQDVTEAARILTGWTLFPTGEGGAANMMQKIVERFGEDKLKERGFVHNGDFLFAANRHDDGEKKVLGKTFRAGGGYEEGVELLKMLSVHPSTAKFISKKLAVRFVSDNPPASLIDKMAATFTATKGDIKQVLITMATSPEFWSKEALREKTKSPFELAISAVRSLNGRLIMPFQLNNWITKMGQQLYYYQAPTGFPDKGQYWINTGALLNRMNFGLALASGKIPGVQFDLAALNKNREPESMEAALRTYSKLLMPERDIEPTVKRLTPLLYQPQLNEKIQSAANNNKAAVVTNDEVMLHSDDDMMAAAKPKNKETVMQASYADKSMLSQVVGIILGSPEYQRR